MKKFSTKLTGLLLALTASALGTAPVAAATPITTTIAESNYSSSDFLWIMEGYSTAAGEMLYPASILDEKIGLEQYTITEVDIPLMSSPDSGTVKVDVYMATTGVSTLSSVYSEGEMTLVARNVEIDFSQVRAGESMKFPLSVPFTMNKEQSLILGLFAHEVNVGSTPTYQSVSVGDGNHMFYGGWGPEAIGSLSWTGQTVAGMALTYVEGDGSDLGGGGQQEDRSDLTVTSIVAPDVEMYPNKVYNFSVNVENLGTLLANNYRVEVVNAEDEIVLGSTLYTNGTHPGMNSRVNVEVMFPTDGTYSVYGRVVFEGDENAENNVCDPISVTVVKLAYRAVSLVGNQEPEVGTPVTYTVTVANDGSNSLSGYTVRLFNDRGMFTPQLLATSEDNPTIAAGGTVEVKFEYTFDLAGSYNLYGQVVIGDAEASNTDELEVSVPLEKLSPVITEQIPEWDGSTNDEYKYSGLLTTDCEVSASQLLYPASYFGEHENAYQIQSVGLTAVPRIYPISPFRLRISLAQTDRTENDPFVRNDKSKLVPAEDFTLVYDGIIQQHVSDKNEIYTCDLQKLFTLESGKSLVVNFQVELLENGDTYYFGLACKEAEQNLVAYSYSNAHIADFNLADANFVSVSKWLPCLTFGYAREPLPAKADLKAGVVKVNTENPEVGAPVSFNVSFENIGTVDIEDYTIELLDMSGAEPVVLESYEGTRYVAPNMTANQTVKYTFDAVGEYQIAARLVVEGDVDDSNNTTETVNVDVAKATVVYNVAAKSIEVTSENPEANKPVNFLVTFENLGNAEIDDFSIELIEVKNGENEVLATFEGKDPVAVGETGTQTLNYTFTKKGDYKLAARVVLAGDADETDNTTPEITVTVNEPDGIDGVIAEGTLEYDAATSTVRVNVGVGVLNVVDMAGRLVASYKLDGPASIRLDIVGGVYYIAAGGKSVKILK